MMKANAILQIEQVSKAFGELKALNGVDLRVNYGEFSALIGPNGAGKSTLFNVVTGLLKKDSGKVVFDGVEITKDTPYMITEKGLSRTFQIVSILPRLSVYDNVLAAVLSQKKQMMNFFARGKRLFKEEVFRILELVGLGGEPETVSSNLAHGDKKRLELGIALANDPKMLLLDEPTSGMAPEETGEIMSLIKRLCDEMGLTIFFVEHDMKAVFGWADRVIVLHYGRVVADGLPEDIRNNALVQEIYLG